MGMQKVRDEAWVHDQDRLDYGIDALTMSVQFALQKAMRENCISQKELSNRLGVSAARVSQILAKDAENLTLKTIAKIADALGEEFELMSRSDVDDLKCRAKKDSHQSAANVYLLSSAHRNRWVDQSAANDRFSVDQVMADFAYAVGQ